MKRVEEEEEGNVKEGRQRREMEGECKSERQCNRWQGECVCVGGCSAQVQMRRQMNGVDVKEAMSESVCVCDHLLRSSASFTTKQESTKRLEQRERERESEGGKEGKEGRHRCTGNLLAASCSQSLISKWDVEREGEKEIVRMESGMTVNRLMCE